MAHLNQKYADKFPTLLIGKITKKQ